MDYFSVIVLVIITFIFITDRKIKNIDYLKKQNENILNDIKEIQENMVVLKFDFEKITHNRLEDVFSNKNNKYLFIENKLLNLDENQREILIANFVNNKKEISGFNIKYNYIDNKKISLKKIFLNLINYLNIFNKNDLTTYGVIILNRKDVDKIKFIRNKKIVCNDITSYVQNKKINLKIDLYNINVKYYIDLYIKKIYNADTIFILKFMLLLITGSFITANLFFSIINIKYNIANFVISLSIYLCYSYIIKYINEPMGKERVIATYIFPIYFIIYLVTLLYVNKNKKINFN